MNSILDCFPTNEHIKKPMPSQVSVILAIEKAFKEGYRNVLLEAPVGSGKSAIAVTCAKHYGTAHIITPRKSLQDQYLADFSNQGVVLMKGRAAYPCTYPSSSTNIQPYKILVNKIETGKHVSIPPSALSCAVGPCKNDAEEFKVCVGKQGDSIDYPCPYNVAIEVAKQSDWVIHNLHSFIFQAYFTGRFEERELMIIDECHEVEGTIRGFAEKAVVLKGIVVEGDIPYGEMKTLDDWCGWFRSRLNLYSENQRVDGSTERQDFLTELVGLTVFSEKFGEKFVVGVERNVASRTTRFVFTPVSVGHLSEKFLLSFGKKRLIMSGTIYNKTLYCRNNGLVESETCFIRIGSTFPKETRPIVLKKEYKVDTSHRMWDQNFLEIITKIKSIMEIFEGAKGLIHSPSYAASLTLEAALRDTGRILSHTNSNFSDKLQEFYNSEEPSVLLSPICQQGVDFKYDRATFQIIIRVPYLNTSDTFVAYQAKNDFPWYNHQALVTFGQQIGRVNRAPDDYGVTFLMDERFDKFISKNKSILPKWLLDGIIYT